jgi:hypothetical protein
MGMDEAARQLRSAVHDAQVAFDCIGLGEIDQAHTHTVTAKSALEAAELTIRRLLADLPPEAAADEGIRAVRALADGQTKR